MDRNREWLHCPIESTAATARTLAGHRLRRARHEVDRLAPTALRKFVAERVIPWERAFRQANPFLCTDDDLWAAFEQSHLFPDLCTIACENEAEYTLWYDANKLLESAT